MSYLIDKEKEEARRRLALLAYGEDPGTIACLERIGVEPGWTCLEVGAGAGTIAAWLADQVGPRGHVTATDLDTTFVEPLASETLTVLRHDISEDELEPESFDLVHTRQVLMHVPARDAALETLARAVKPGGWILVEDVDSSTDGPDPTAPDEMQALYREVIAEIYDFAMSKGLDPTYGSTLFGRLRTLGFEELVANGRVHIYRGDPDTDASSHVPAFVELRDLIVERGVISGDRFDAFLGLTRNPDFSWREGLTVAAWGRKPGR